MGKCIVCGKFAGPFNDLHKSCFAIYRETQKQLQDKISQCTNQDAFSTDLLDEIKACKPRVEFSPSLFLDLLTKVWSEQAKLCVNHSSINSLAAENFLQIAEYFEIQDSDGVTSLLNRLLNLKTLKSLQDNQKIQANIECAPDTLVLSDSENIVWWFDDIARTEQQRYSEEKSWTVLRSVLDNTLLKSRYKQLATKTETSGGLLISDHALYYIKNNEITTTKFSDIHSVTPIKNGIRLQASTRGATPDTYITGDGRFTFALFQYAKQQYSYLQKQ